MLSYREDISQPEVTMPAMTRLEALRALLAKSREATEPAHESVSGAQALFRSPRLAFELFERKLGYLRS